jgi:ribonucleoside-diphosphate reductase alpha chain
MTPRDTASPTSLTSANGEHGKSGLRLLQSVAYDTMRGSYRIEQHHGAGVAVWFARRGELYLTERGFEAATVGYALGYASDGEAQAAIRTYERRSVGIENPPLPQAVAETCRPGLAIDYVFSDPTRDPCDATEWRWVDAEIKDEAGKAIFRQRVEVPAGWSDRAAQVVASKYFWGDADKGDDPHEGGREHSVRQLIGRVTRTLARWGAEDGYFATPLDAARFERELRWLCLNQYGAFNSPVWFNVGLADAYGLQGRPANWRWDAGAVVGANGDRTVGAAVPADDLLKYAQASACFIQSVSDDMEGIMALATSEALLFKNGSGTGTDLSSLRSTREKLTGGGKPSGPVSFMRIYDAGASVIKSGGRTRRSAKMQILRCDHPDIMEYVRCKVKEDRKARALIAAGYSAGMTGHPDEAYSSVYFQNSNLSVGVTDAFMERTTSTDPDFRKWSTIAVTTGDPVETLDAGAVLDAVAAGTWECGDPGVEFLDALNRWHTIPHTAPIRACNPCSEFVHVDDSACNLASLNLMKFRRADGSFDAERFRAAVAIFIVAQEIIVDRASYPTKAICENSHRSRPLGLGYSNLGALLMASGLPYDSDGARDLAGAITSLMTAQAYRLSAAVAAFKGPFVFFEANREPMLKVIGMHRDAASDLFHRAYHPEALRLAVEAGLLWDGCRGLGERYGFRNSQVTLVPPAGTISFMMDCDTTGLEPELALVKYKNLAGGGQLKLVNGIVPTALETLGYDGPEVRAIAGYIEAHDTIEGAPGLKDEHLPVFDCAFPTRPGGRSIPWRGHVRMVAAIQPHISGASSKTINMPESSTVEEIRDAYVEGWRLGVKAMAIYRDNSKGAQPVQVRPPAAGVPVDGPGEPVASSSAPDAVIARPRRERLPATRQSVTRKIEISGHEGYAIVGLYPDGRPGELFLKLSRGGSTIDGLMDTIGILTSLCLQYGVPVEVLESKFVHTKFDPCGPTGDPEHPWATSLPDYIFSWMAREFGDGRSGSVGPVPLPAVLPAAVGSMAPIAGGAPVSTGPACPDCGAMMVPAGRCFSCALCGASGGCG